MVEEYGVVKTCLELGDDTILFQEPHKSIVDNPFKGFAQTTCYSYWSIIIWDCVCDLYLVQELGSQLPLSMMEGNYLLPTYR